MDRRILNQLRLTKKPKAFLYRRSLNKKNIRYHTLLLFIQKTFFFKDTFTLRC